MIANSLPNYSVLMSVYYKEKPEYLEFSINSMLNQTYPTNDFVLVCDGPLSKELNVIITRFEESFPCFRTIRLEKNQGLGIALNIGLQKCKNDYVARMDSDDYSESNRCEIQLKELTSNNLDLIGSSITEFKEDLSNSVGVRKVPKNTEDIIKFSKKRNPFNHPSVIYRKSAVLKAGGYSEEYHLFEDYHLWIRMLLNDCKCKNLDISLVKMRVNDSFVDRRGGKQYMNNMLYFHKWLKNSGWTSSIDYITGAIPHAFICCLPVSLRKFSYKFLRK